MTEDEVRVKLRRLVSPQDPDSIYEVRRHAPAIQKRADMSKSQLGKKVGKGASGVVYVARVHNSAKKVAIKTMVLSKQPRKVTGSRLAVTLTVRRTCCSRRLR